MNTPFHEIREHGGRRLAHILGLYLPLLAFWLLLSGKYDAFHTALGLVCVGLVVATTEDLGYSTVRPLGGPRSRRSLILFPWWRMAGYLPWLLWSIVQSNFQVAAMVLTPRMPIDPVLIRFKSKLHSDLARTTLGNSITLTPGTVTVDLEAGEFTVHALTSGLADSLVVGDMQRRVAHVFGEDEWDTPPVLKGHSSRDLQA